MIYNRGGANHARMQRRIQADSVFRRRYSFVEKANLVAIVRTRMTEDRVSFSRDGAMGSIAKGYDNDDDGDGRQRYTGDGNHEGLRQRRRWRRATAIYGQRRSRRVTTTTTMATGDGDIRATAIYKIDSLLIKSKYKLITMQTYPSFQ